MQAGDDDNPQKGGMDINVDYRVNKKESADQEEEKRGHNLSPPAPDTNYGGGFNAKHGEDAKVKMSERPFDIPQCK